MKKMLSVILIVLFGSVGLAYGQSAKDAIKSLKKLEAKVEVGISYQKYREDLGDANAEVKLFLEGKDAKKSPELVRSVNKVMDNYKDAADLWEKYVEAKDAPEHFNLADPESFRQFWPKLTDTYQSLFKKYPKANDKVFNRPGMSCSRGIILKDFLNVIWAEASKELKKASNYLQD